MINTTRLILNNIYDLSDLRNNTLLLYFGLPNSPIVSINDEEEEELTISRSDLEIESDSEKSNEIIYRTFFSQLLHK